MEPLPCARKCKAGNGMVSMRTDTGNVALLILLSSRIVASSRRFSIPSVSIGVHLWPFPIGLRLRGSRHSAQPRRADVEASGIRLQGDDLGHPVFVSDSEVYSAFPDVRRDVFFPPESPRLDGDAKSRPHFSTGVMEAVSSDGCGGSRQQASPPVSAMRAFVSWPIQEIENRGRTRRNATTPPVPCERWRSVSQRPMSEITTVRGKVFPSDP